MEIKIVTEPVIIPIAEMSLNTLQLSEVIKWVANHRPECLPDEPGWKNLFPHNCIVSDNELLVELAGRNCYHSFGLKAGKKSNGEYIANTQLGDIPHASILYHAKMTFFFAGISRRVSHELIRNYVGADRDEEGSPSQESTRFTHHYGHFVMPPKYLNSGSNEMKEHFKKSMQIAYDNYVDAVNKEIFNFGTPPPTGIEKKRIYEAASSFLPHQAETSFVWTTNPMAIAKLCKERDHSGADLEIQRFAHKFKQVSVSRWPNLFPQPWMNEL